MCDEKTRVKDINALIGESSKGKVETIPCLLVISGINVGMIYKLKKNRIIIGRGDECDITLRESSISRVHAAIDIDLSGEATITDMKSTNGTFVNGVPVSFSSITNGVRIQLGSSTVLKFVLQDSFEAEFQANMYESVIKDTLTQAYNKRYFLDRITSEFSHSLRHYQQLALIMIDVDHFKQVNDTYGHLAGDEVLKELVKRITGHLRLGDVLCRYGGEEFVIIVRECNPESLLPLAERILDLFREKPMNFKDETISITISAGVSSIIDKNVRTVEDLLAEADKNLYLAKSAGRNCVRSSQDMA